MRIIIPNDPELRSRIDMGALVATAQNPPDWHDAVKNARKFLRAEKAAKSITVIAKCDHELVLGSISRTDYKILWWFQRGTTLPPSHWDWDWD